ncbi:hypothetical protein DEO72_LG3g1267 [Vigna unguiculata]|uniref:Uncharacterized protein n=1 Tax=Vigna unguiculata TaxID=3917 RepID=A0A4D6LDQ0_VIGUN|nr:hypothetical protein DEO72_LG3g1267 [Vigna unguiculata]
MTPAPCRRVVSPPATLLRQWSLSLSLCKCSGVPPPPREHFGSFAAIVVPRFFLSFQTH